MIALILGGAKSVWADLAAAEALLGDARRLIIATNSAGFLYEGRIDALASLHPELLDGFRAKRTGNTDFRTFAPGPGPLAEIAPEKWPASSGGYGLQIALFEMGATAAILCGVPLSREGGHIVQEGPWNASESYRQAFRSMLPEIGGRVRAMSGFTRELFGAPTPEWLASTVFLKPARPASAPQRTLPMHHVKNVSDQAQAFNIRLPDGNLRRQHLQPGEGGAFECDPNQAVFVRGHLTATEVTATPTPKAPAKAKAAPKAKPRTAPKAKVAPKAAAPALARPDPVSEA